jgi:hypothetical protein
VALGLCLLLPTMVFARDLGDGCFHGICVGERLPASVKRALKAGERAGGCEITNKCGFVGYHCDATITIGGKNLIVESLVTINGLVDRYYLEKMSLPYGYTAGGYCNALKKKYASRFPQRFETSGLRDQVHGVSGNCGGGFVEFDRPGLKVDISTKFIQGGTVKRINKNTISVEETPGKGEWFWRLEVDTDRLDNQISASFQRCKPARGALP